MRRHSEMISRGYSFFCVPSKAIPFSVIAHRGIRNLEINSECLDTVSTSIQKSHGLDIELHSSILARDFIGLSMGPYFFLGVNREPSTNASRISPVLDSQIEGADAGTIEADEFINRNLKLSMEVLIVLTLAGYHQILWTIVGLIPVDVMDYLFPVQSSAKNCFYHKSVLWHRSASRYIYEKITLLADRSRLWYVHVVKCINDSIPMQSFIESIP